MPDPFTPVSSPLRLARLTLIVSPGARRDEILGRYSDGWKVRVRSAPERGRANHELVALLASALAVPRDAVRIVSGHSSRRKIVEVDGLGEAEAGRRLEEGGARG
ncbi:MAG TPA: DUF167 domain-containing protein [Gaiellaceae bacterium]|jgi:hypothetical protein